LKKKSKNFKKSAQVQYSCGFAADTAAEKSALWAIFQVTLAALDLNLYPQ
jgi:hypothetical protein